MSATSLGRTGSLDFILQRFSAVIMAAYFLTIVGFLLSHQSLDYATWSAFFNLTAMKVFSSLAILAIVIHAFIGLWVVVTDYLTTRLLGTKGTALRLFCQAGYSLILFYYLVWGLMIVWGGVK